jgi:hypothetical protein
VKHKETGKIIDLYVLTLRFVDFRRVWNNSALIGSKYSPNLRLMKLNCQKLSVSIRWLILTSKFPAGRRPRKVFVIYLPVLPYEVKKISTVSDLPSIVLFHNPTRVFI